MGRKSRAQLDAERMAALEAAQQQIDTGGATVEEIEARLNSANADDGVSADDLEAMYAELEARANPGNQPPEPPQPPEPQADPHELAELKRKLSFYEQELNPTRRRSQELEREVEELRAKLAAVPPEPETPTDYGLDEEERELDAVVRISEKVSKAMNAKLLKELDSVRAQLKKFQDASIQSETENQINAHRNELTKHLGGVNPDDLFSNPKIVAWANELPEEELLALRNPVAYSPRFVAGLLNRFQSEVLKGQAKREPSHGEVSIPSRVAPDVVVRKDGPDASGPRFDPRTFQTDVNKLIADGKIQDAEKLISAAERAMSA